MNRVQNKVAIVTGGASGLGKAIARRLVEEGGRVIITDIQTELGNSTAKALSCDFFQQDVVDESQWEKIIGQVEEKYAGLHILVNNAGILGALEKASPETTQLADWKRIQSVNVDSVLLGCRAAIPLLRRTGAGSIINISSIAGSVASPYATAYGASKAAVRHLTKSIAQHCAETRSNIRCNSVHPGIIMTPMNLGSLEERSKLTGQSIETLLKESQSLIPMGEFTEAEDVANAVLWLASDESRYVTGIKLAVDGGIENCETFSPKNQKN